MTMHMNTRILAPATLVVVIVLAMLVPVSVPQRASATHTGADEIGVSAAVLRVMQTPAGTSSLPVTLLTATARSGATFDLVVELAAECALWTDIVPPEPEAAAQVTVWVERNGIVLPVTRDANGDGIASDPDDGRVVLCNRAFKLAAPASDVSTLYQNARQANAFNWVVYSVPGGTHTLQVRAQLNASVTGVGTFAQAAVGKRTLKAGGALLAGDATF
jgi:hypothetical protein